MIRCFDMRKSIDWLDYQSLLQCVSCFNFCSIQLLKKHTLNPEITILYQFHDQKALFKVPKISNINFWIENDPPPSALFQKYIDLVARPFLKGNFEPSGFLVTYATCFLGHCIEKGIKDEVYQLSRPVSLGFYLRK